MYSPFSILSPFSVEEVGCSVKGGVHKTSDFCGLTKYTMHTGILNILGTHALFFYVCVIQLRDDYDVYTYYKNTHSNKLIRFSLTLGLKGNVRCW